MNEQIFYWAVQGFSTLALALIVGLGILTGQHAWFSLCALLLLVTMVLRHKSYEAGNKGDGDVHHY